MIRVAVPDADDLETVAPCLFVGRQVVLGVEDVAVGETIRGQIAGVGDAGEPGGVAVVPAQEQAARLVGVAGAGELLDGGPVVRGQLERRMRTCRGGCINNRPA
jgi:hypothetical protein